MAFLLESVEVDYRSVAIWQRLYHILNHFLRDISNVRLIVTFIFDVWLVPSVGNSAPNFASPPPEYFQRFIHGDLPHPSFQRSLPSISEFV